MDYTAVGQTTHLAARMEQMATPARSSSPPDTLALAEGYVAGEVPRPDARQGAERPIEVYELAGAERRALASPGRRRARPLRASWAAMREMEQLRRALEQAREGRGQVVGRDGRARRRQVAPVLRAHSLAPHRRLAGPRGGLASPTARPRSYLPVIDLLKAYFHVGDRDTPREMREKVTGKLLTPGSRPASRCCPRCSPCSGVPVEDPAWQALDPAQRRQRTLDAVKRLLLRESQAQPLLVVFEDLHWIDAETQAFLDGLVESLPTARMLLLVNYRPEYQHGWGSKTYYTPAPARSTATGERGRAAPRAARGRRERRAPRAPADRAHGGQSLLPRRERARPGRDEGAGGRARRLPAGAAPSDASGPADRPGRARRSHRPAPAGGQALAPVGRGHRQGRALHAPAGHRRRAGGRAPCAGLAHLQAAEFLYEPSLFPDLEYTFKHALTHEVAYGACSRSAAGSSTPGSWRPSSGCTPIRWPSTSSGSPDHAMRGEIWEKAAAYAAPSGTQAADRSAPGGQGVLRHGAGGPSTHCPSGGRRSSSHRAPLSLHRGRAVPLGDPEAYLACIDEARRSPSAIGDQDRLGLCSGDQIPFWIVGETAPALDSGAALSPRRDADGPRAHRILPAPTSAWPA